MRIRLPLGSTIQDRSSWLVLLALLFGVLAPAAAVIWFMNEAMVNQEDASRQRVSEAYRGQLRLLRDSIDADWKARAIDLARVDGTGASAFRRAVLTGRADAMVFLAPDGMLDYPARQLPQSSDPLEQRLDWRSARLLENAGLYQAAATSYNALIPQLRNASLAARAAQAQARALVRAGEVSAAARVAETRFHSGPLASGRDLHGRLIAADVHLLLIRLLPATDKRRAHALERLTALVNDYELTRLPSSQRLFLMTELRDAHPESVLPTYDAERLAAEFVQADGTVPQSRVLEPSSMAGIWKLRVRDEAIALFTTKTIADAARSLLREQNAAAGVRFAMVAPGEAGADEGIAASPLLPGWQIAYTLLDSQRAQEASRQRTATYLWAGTLAIAVLAVGGLLLWQAFHRQLRLTRLRTDLMAAVSHELKTPLASMRLLVDSLLEDEPDRKRTRDYLQLVAGENARLTRLIDHFLTFSRLERGRHRFAFATVYPEAIVGSAVNLVRERFDAAHTRLDVDVAPNLPPLYGDQDALVTVLLNLLENAYAYTRDEKEIRVHAFHDTNSVVFEVEDNGIGIGRRDQKRVFRRFYRVDESLSRESGGCGLGLSIVDYIVRAHGGAIALRSQLGVGSRFRITVPCRRAAEATGP
jgi:signal transduction histidine kinase